MEEQIPLDGKFNRIKDILVEQGRSQTWLAKQLGLTVRQVNFYCSNSVQPSIPTLYTISTLLNVPISELLRDSDKVPTKIK